LAAATPRPQPKSFQPPPDRKAAPSAAPPSIDTPAPPVTSPAATGAESFAIASLEPSKFTEVPAPPASHAAGFSGAPELHPEDAGAAPSESAALVVPGLTAGGGVPDALPTVAPAPEVSPRSRLLAELRSPITPGPLAAPAPGAPKALRVSAAPDPRLEGRVVYAMAIQMANVTSHSGSWMVWFAERIPQPGAPPANVRPPEPRHKVDPAYIRSAADQRIEGVVKLAAVICKDGRVDRIELLSGIDNRLDESAVEALGKWLFVPALRDGAPIEVDAVFEVPFRLAPKPSPKTFR
jgi:TonB family protein